MHIHLRCIVLDPTLGHSEVLLSVFEYFTHIYLPVTCRYIGRYVCGKPLCVSSRPKAIDCHRTLLMYATKNFKYHFKYANHSISRKYMNK